MGSAAYTLALGTREQRWLPRVDDSFLPAVGRTDEPTVAAGENASARGPVDAVLHPLGILPVLTHGELEAKIEACSCFWRARTPDESYESLLRAGVCFQLPGECELEGVTLHVAACVFSFFLPRFCPEGVR